MEILSPDERDSILEHERRVLQLSLTCGRHDGQKETSCERIGNWGGSREGDEEEKEGGRGVSAPNSGRSCCGNSRERWTSAESLQTHMGFRGSGNYSTTGSELEPGRNHSHGCTKRGRGKGLYSFLNITRLKLARSLHLESSHAANFASFFIANFLCGRLRGAKFATTLLLCLMLFTALVPSTRAEAQQNFGQKSHSTFPSEPWIIDDVESDSEHVSEVSDHTEHRRKGLPDFVLPVNKLFWFELSKDAFGSNEAIQHYKVRHWSWYITSDTGTPPTIST